MNFEKRKEGAIKVITFGEVMLRLSTPAFSRFTQATHFNITYGGAEANVAISLRNLGLQSAHVTRFPNNDLGIAATQELQKYGVDTRHIVYGDERMGVYFLENGAIHRASRIVYDRFDSAFSHIKADSIDWEDVLKDATWFHWTGITPAISQGAADACLKALQVAKKLGVHVSGDINYRRNLWQYGKSARDVMPSLIDLTDVVIAGITDMDNCTGVRANTYEDACAQLKKKHANIKRIATTERESVSSSHNRIFAMLWSEDKLIQSKTYDLTHIVDRVGSGDAFMAGLIYGLLTKGNNGDALAFAIAACAWKHTVEGDANLATAAEIENLVKGENVGKLLR